jgi:hypothetical protein
MPELISHCYKNDLDRCEEKWVWKLWCQWTGRRWQLFMWTSCGDVTVTVQTFIVTIIRHQKVYLHITHKISYSCRTFLRIAMIANEGKQRVSEWLVPLLQSNGSKNRGSWLICLFVTWDPSILHQAVDNLEVKSEPDHLTNACARRCVRKRKKINKAWESNRVILRGLTARC